MKNTINTWLKAGMIIFALAMTVLYPFLDFTYSRDIFELYRYAVQFVGVLLISAGTALIFRRFYTEHKKTAVVLSVLFAVVLMYVTAFASDRRFMYFAELFTLSVWPIACYVIAKKSASSDIGRNNAIAGYSIYSAATVAFIFITEEVLFRYPYFQADVVGEAYMYVVALIAYFVYAVSKKDRRFCAKEIVFSVLLTLGIAVVWFMCQERICEIRETLKYSFTDVSVDGDLENWLAYRIRMLYAAVHGDVSALNYHYMPALKSGCPVVWIVSVGGWGAGALILGVALALGALVGVYAFRTESTAERIVCIGFLLKMAFSIANNMFMVFSSSVGIPLVKFSFDIIALVFIVFGSAIKAEISSADDQY